MTDTATNTATATDTSTSTATATNTPVPLDCENIATGDGGTVDGYGSVGDGDLYTIPSPGPGEFPFAQCVFDNLPGGTIDISQLTYVGTTFDVQSGNCGLGSPRFRIVFQNGNQLLVYIGDAPSFTNCTPAGDTGNLLTSGGSGRCDWTFSGLPGASYSDCSDVVSRLTGVPISLLKFHVEQPIVGVFNPQVVINPIRRQQQPHRQQRTLLPNTATATRHRDQYRHCDGYSNQYCHCDRHGDGYRHRNRNVHTDAGYRVQDPQHNLERLNLPGDLYRTDLTDGHGDQVSACNLYFSDPNGLYASQLTYVGLGLECSSG